MSPQDNSREQALLIPCQDEHMLAILSHAAQTPGPALKIGVLIIVGGPQYRAGSHRQFTLLARSLARQGVASLRMDYRGMGDSEGELRDFESVSEDIAVAIDAFVEQAQLDQVLLWGLCDAASAALLYCHDRRDPRVRGLILLNPWARSGTSLAKTQLKHYYLDRLSQPEFWKKLLGGGVGRQALQDLLANAATALGRPRAASAPAGAATKSSAKDRRLYQQRMASAWREFGGPILLIISGMDLTAKEFLDHANSDPDWRGLLSQSKVQRVNLPEADHTFSKQAASLAVQEHTLALVRHLSI